MKFEEAVVLLELSLTKSIQRFDEKSGILFSGGLDSSIIAKICEELNKDVKLYSVGMKGSYDLKHVERAREFFNFEINVREIREEELEGYAEKVVHIIHTSDPMHVSIGIPIYLACESAKKDGVTLLLSGQGADELFAGYHRYLSLAEEELELSLSRDYEKLLKVDIPRDIAIATANSVEIRFPFLDEEVVKVAFDIPASWKLKNGIRKYILRELAKQKGVPDFIYEGRKRAIQYSTGTHRALRKLARKRI
jgi:asparagine synthase (glutamine-hydrolysing)